MASKKSAKTGPKVGCAKCKEAFNIFGNPGLDEVLECSDAFIPKFDFFSVSLLRCPSCETDWLYGYYEDFTNTPIEVEWGKRSWFIRPVTENDIATIEKSRNTKSLEVETFGKS